MSNDTATATQKGSLNTNAKNSAGTGNDTFGYTGGGYNPAATTPGNSLSLVQRIDYLNDTATALVKGGPLLMDDNCRQWVINFWILGWWF